MGELLLHVGWPKTGTSSLQHMLRAHPNLAGKPYDRPGGEVAREIRRGLVIEPGFDVERLARHLADAQTDPELPVIYSDEGCTSMPPHHWHRGYIAPELVAERLAKAAAGWDARVLLTVRDGVDLLRSSYRHTVRNGFDRSYADYITRIASDVERSDGPFAAGTILDAYRELFGAENVAVLHLDRIVAGTFWADAAEELALPSLAGLTGAEVPHENRHELGPITAEVLANRYLFSSKFNPPRGLRRVRSTWFRRKVSDRVPRWGVPTRFDRHDPEIEAAIAARFDAAVGTARLSGA